MNGLWTISGMAWMCLEWMDRYFEIVCILYMTTDQFHFLFLFVIVLLCLLDLFAANRKETTFVVCSKFLFCSFILSISSCSIDFVCLVYFIIHCNKYLSYFWFICIGNQEYTHWVFQHSSISTDSTKFLVSFKVFLIKWIKLF